MYVRPIVVVAVPVCVQRGTAGCLTLHPLHPLSEGRCQRTAGVFLDGLYRIPDPALLCAGREKARERERGGVGSEKVGSEIQQSFGDSRFCLDPPLHVRDCLLAGLCVRSRMEPRV